MTLAQVSVHTWDKSFEQKKLGWIYFLLIYLLRQSTNVTIFSDYKDGEHIFCLYRWWTYCLFKQLMNIFSVFIDYAHIFCLYIWWTYFLFIQMMNILFVYTDTEHIFCLYRFWTYFLFDEHLSSNSHISWI